ncbi:hypothetical protein D3C75_617320 [compost metagenome]
MLHNVVLQARQLFNLVHIIHGSEKLMLGQFIPGGPVAADAHTDKARAAALALRLVHRMENALADAVQIAPGLAQSLHLAGQAVLDIFVLAAAALQDQPHINFILFPLLKMDNRRSRPQVVAAVGSRERIHGVGAQNAVPCRLGYRLADRFLHHNLVGPYRNMDNKSRHARVLADGRYIAVGHADILSNGCQRDLRPP